MNTEILLEKPKEETNYFYRFDFLKFKKILLPLAIIAFFLIIKQIIINNFNTASPENHGILNLINYNTPKQLPVWAETINFIIDILIIMVILCWEAVYEKKYDKIKFVLLLSIPSVIMALIVAYSDFYESYTKSPFYIIYPILSYFPCYALYGALRGKILYGKKLSFIGYLIGLMALVDINTLYGKLFSAVLQNDFFSPVYSYGLAIAKVFIPLSFFYFLFLTDGGFSFKNFIKMPAVTLLPKKKFTAHFLFLFTTLISLHLYFTENFSVSWFNYMTSSIWSILFTVFNLIQVIFKVAFVYLIFSQLLLLQLGALRRRPLWIYLLSFIPVVNVFPLVFFYRNNAPVTDTDYIEIEGKEDRNRLLLQLFSLLFTSIYFMYKFKRSDLSDQNLYLIMGAFILIYIFILFFRIGVWFALAALGIAAIFMLLQDIPTGFYYIGFASYAAIGLYNLHISLFWQAEEWDEVEENVEVENN